MNILILTTHVNSGGITSYIWRLVRMLTQRGHHLVVVSSGGNMEKDIEEVGGEHVTFNIRTKSELSPKIYLAIPNLCRLIKEKNIDIIHAQTRVTQVMAAFLSKLMGKPYVSTCHGFYKRRWSRLFLPCWGDAVIAISAAVRKHLISDFRIPEHKVSLIHHGVDPIRFKPINEERKKELRRDLGLGDEPVVGIMARLSDVKGHKVLLSAMKKVVEKIPEAILLIIGTGRLESELKEMTKNLGLEKNVHFHPTVNHPVETLGIFDVSVVPSLEEGLGFSILESQSMALPVVASRTGGIVDIIKDGKTGVLVEPGDAKGLSEAIIRLLTDKAKARLIGLAGRKSIEGELSIDKMIDKTETFYKELVHKI